jgi:hypothetical protein
MADLNSILADPDFLASTAETKRQILSAHDQDFAAATPTTQDQILAQYGPRDGGIKSAPPRDDEALSIPTLSQAYSTMVDPITKAVGWAAARTPMATPAQYLTGTPDATMESGSQKAAEILVPQTPMTAGMMLGGGIGGAAGIGLNAGRALTATGSVLGGALGGEAGGQIQGAPRGQGALIGGIGTALGEGAGALGQWLANIGIGAKANINEAQTSAIKDVIDTVNPALGGAIDAARPGLSPFLKGGQTAAAYQEAALGRSGKEAMSGAFEQGMLDTTLAAQGQGITSPALMTTWRRFPTGQDAAGNVTDELANQLWRQLAPSPNGTFSPAQAERLLAELGEAAFKGEAASPIARGMGGLQLRDLYRQAREQSYAGLPPEASQAFEGTRRAFAGGEAFAEAGRQSNAFQGLPNRVMLNTPSVQKYISDNRAELQAKLGDEGYRALLDALYAGGQIGTRDILTPGSGEAMTALRQVYGRGQGGAPQIIGSAARTLAPNLGAQMTGRGFYNVDPGVQALLDYLGMQTADQFKGALGGQPVKIGPVP